MTCKKNYYNHAIFHGTSVNIKFTWEFKFSVLSNLQNSGEHWKFSLLELPWTPTRNLTRVFFFLQLPEYYFSPDLSKIGCTSQKYSPRCFILINSQWGSFLCPFFKVSGFHVRIPWEAWKNLKLGHTTEPQNLCGQDLNLCIYLKILRWPQHLSWAKKHRFLWCCRCCQELNRPEQCRFSFVQCVCVKEFITFPPSMECN